MKVILTKDLPRVGVKGQVLDVSDAYAMNVIIGKGNGVRATEQMIKSLKLKEEQKKQEKEKQVDKYREVFEDISEIGITLKKKVDEKGNLYAKLSVHDIVDAVFALKKISINEKQVHVPDMHTLGETEMVLENNNKKYKVKVNIVKG